MKPRFFTPLSAVQIKGLCALANQAYKAAKARQACADITADEFRRQGQLEAAGVASLKEANQSHYLAIKGKWWTVIGNLEEAFYCFLNEGPQNQAHRQMAWRFAGQTSYLAEAIATKEHYRLVNEAIKALPPGEMILPECPRMTEAEAARQAWAYAQSISRDKFGRRGISFLTTDELEQLGFTTINRANAMLGKGSSESRNKSQRRSRRGSDLATEERQSPSTPTSGLSLVARAAARLSAVPSTRP